MQSLVPGPLAWTIAMTLALLLGSFLNVCIARLPRHLSIVRPGSHCPRCLSPVRPRDNLPVLGWLLLRGRCRDCRQPITPRYPLVELAYAGLVAASLARFGYTAEGVAASLFCFLALGLLVMDLETMLLPDAFTLPGLGLGLLWASMAWVMPATRGAEGAFEPAGLMAAALAAGGSASILMAVRWSYYAVRRRHGLGLGDIKLVAMLAAWLGAPRMALCFLLAVVVAALTGLFAAAFSGSSEGKSDWRIRKLALGAYLCAASLFTLFCGDRVLTWYMSFWV